MKKYIDRLIEELIKAENELECRAEIEEVIKLEGFKVTIKVERDDD